MRHLRPAILWGVSLAAVAAVAFLPRVPQDPAYHQFADRRCILGVANFFDVVSNLPISLAGGWGLWVIFRRLWPGSGNEPERRRTYLLYLCFFAAVAFTGIGSAYYHLSPDNGRLFWDRLPLSLTFMCLLAAVIGERAGAKYGIALLPFLWLAAAGSVIYWRVSEQAGMGDLRPYGLVQFYPLLLIVLLVVLYPARYVRGKYYFGLLLFYGLAKAAEVLDGRIFSLGHLLSGHTLKHLLSAAAVGWVIFYLNRAGNRIKES
ncbi:MAG: alkaline phytoceramidase [Candidatus Glassbacteria bacterium]